MERKQRFSKENQNNFILIFGKTNNNYVKFKNKIKFKKNNMPKNKIKNKNRTYTPPNLYK